MHRCRRQGGAAAERGLVLQWLRLLVSELIEHVVEECLAGIHQHGRLRAGMGSGAQRGGDRGAYQMMSCSKQLAFDIRKLLFIIFLIV